MGFFGDLRRPPEPEALPPGPEWLEAPPGWLGGVIPEQLPLGASPSAAVFITHLTAYPAGFSFRLEAVTRDRNPRQPYPFDLDWETGGGEELPPELLRYGLQFSDGRKATSGYTPIEGRSSRLMAIDEDLPPDAKTQLILSPGGGGGGAGRFAQDCWVWPLPPAGPLAFVCAWPAYEISEQRVEVDASIILDAAQRARQVWPEHDP